MRDRVIQLLLVLALFVTTNAWSQNSKDAARAIIEVTQNPRLAEFNFMEDPQWRPLAAGVHIYSNSEKYQWENIPDELRNTQFLTLPIHRGVLDFEVASEGFAFIITSTRWGGGGNSSGDWQDSVLSEKDLRREGWRQLREIKDLVTGDPGEMAVFWRYCKAGEKHRIRTEKYVAPMLLIR